MNLPKLKNEKEKNVFRYIIEISCMSNNDEYVYYLKRDNNYPSFKEFVEKYGGLEI